MAVTRLKRKNRKDKSKSAVRRQSLKIQNAKPVIKNVDIEKIKEAFKAKKAWSVLYILPLLYSSPCSLSSKGFYFLTYGLQADCIS